MYRMMQSFLFMALLFIGIPIFSQEITNAINFGRESTYGRFITASELEVWASGKKLVVLPDCGLRDEKDDEAEMIPSTGMNFMLDAPGKGRVYLYLDLVNFRPSSEYLQEDACRPSMKSYQSGTYERNILKIRWLDVIVNQKLLYTIYYGGGVFPSGPIVIPIERETIPDRRLRIRLLPSPGDPFFSIWDAFVSPVMELDQE